MKNTLLLLAAVGVTATASAQTNITSGSGDISITATGLSYMQDFNTLDTSSDIANVSDNLPTGWYIVETGTGAAADGKYRGGDGSTNSGNMYSYGTFGTTDRALGSLASSSVSPLFGAKFVNNTGAAITGATVTLKMEQWRVGDSALVVDTTLFSYSTTASGIDDTTSANWMMDNSLMLNSVVVNQTVLNGGSSLNGNSSASSRNMTATLTMNIPSGSTFYFRWKDKNVKGGDHGLSIDDMNVVFTTGPSAVSNVATNNLPLSLMGNGTSNDVKAAFTAPENGAYTLTVTDLAGRVVSSTEGAATKGQTVVAPVSNQTLASGLYLVRIAQGTFAGIEKLSVR